MYTGLMDRAQTTFTPAGLDVPSYWSNGNHDVLVQGNEDATAPLEDIATACFKALGTTLALPPSSPGPDFVPDPNLLLAPTAAGMLVPPDPERRFLDRPQIKQVLGADGEDDAHGFDFVDPAEETAIERQRLLLRLGPAADTRLPLHQHRHELRGRPDRRGRGVRLVERQHRRPAVPVADLRSSTPLRPPTS